MQNFVVLASRNEQTPPKESVGLNQYVLKNIPLCIAQYVAACRQIQEAALQQMLLTDEQLRAAGKSMTFHCWRF